MEFLIVVLALVVIGMAFFFGTKRKAARQQFGAMVYDFPEKHRGIMAKLAKAAGLRKEDDQPARRWPVEADDLIQSMEPVALSGNGIIRDYSFDGKGPSKPSARDAFHKTWRYGRVTERVSPTRVKVLFEGDVNPARRRINRLVMVRKAVPLPAAA